MSHEFITTETRGRVALITLNRPKQLNALSPGLMQELGARMPPLKRVLIDERDRFIAERMRRAEGNRLVGVIGAGHVDGIRQALLDSSPVDLAALEVIPPPSGLWRWVGYSIPALIIGSIVLIGVREGAAAAQANVYLWIVANGLPTMLGTLIAGGHPITALSGFVAAPITKRDMEAGPQAVQFDGRSLQGTTLRSGIFFVQLQLGNSLASGKLVVTD